MEMANANIQFYSSVLWLDQNYDINISERARENDIDIPERDREREIERPAKRNMFCLNLIW